MIAPMLSPSNERHMAQISGQGGACYAATDLSVHGAIARSHTQLPTLATCHTCTPSPVCRSVPNGSAHSRQVPGAVRFFFALAASALMTWGQHYGAKQTKRADQKCRSSKQQQLPSRSLRSQGASTLTQSAPWPARRAVPSSTEPSAAPAPQAQSSVARRASSVTTLAFASNTIFGRLTPIQTFGKPPFGHGREGVFLCT